MECASCDRAVESNRPVHRTTSAIDRPRAAPVQSAACLSAQALHIRFAQAREPGDGGVIQIRLLDESAGDASCGLGQAFLAAFSQAFLTAFSQAFRPLSVAIQ